VKDADGQTTVIASIGDAENARPENDGQRKTTGLENARVENDRQKLRGLEMQDWKMTDKILANSGQNYGVWKMQDWKMTDSILANSEQNYGVWKIQDWKMTDKLYAKWLSAVSYTY